MVLNVTNHYLCLLYQQHRPHLPTQLLIPTRKQHMSESQQKCAFPRSLANTTKKKGIDSETRPFQPFLYFFHGTFFRFPPCHTKEKKNNLHDNTPLSCNTVLLKKKLYLVSIPHTVTLRLPSLKDHNTRKQNEMKKRKGKNGDPR
jgi:hypothetical protein